MVFVKGKQICLYYTPVRIFYMVFSSICVELTIFPFVLVTPIMIVKYTALFLPRSDFV